MSSSRRTAIARTCLTVVESNRFTALVFCLILGNAVLLGLETYSGVVEEWGHVLNALEHMFLAGFVLETVLRGLAHADRPGRYFRDPWNLFDLAIVLLVCPPFASQNATGLRLLRLARVLRAARLMPQLRIIVVAIGKSLPGAIGFVMVGTLLLYVYAMIGWAVFSAEDPVHYGSLGRAALSLFLLVTLDGLGDAVRAGMAISPWSLLYFASYVLLGSFVLVNILIGVVLNSLDEARQLEDKDARVPASRTTEHLHARIATARAALDDLENGLSSTAGSLRSAGPAPVPQASIPKATERGADA